MREAYCKIINENVKFRIQKGIEGKLEGTFAFGGVGGVIFELWLNEEDMNKIEKVLEAREKIDEEYFKISSNGMIKQGRKEKNE